jgi:hypothetical protein
MKFHTTTLFLVGLAAAAPLAYVHISKSKTQTHSQYSQVPVSADAARASSILSGLADGLKGSSIPLSGSAASIISGIAGGLGGNPSRTANIDVDALSTSNLERRQAQRQPPSSADMERASGILKGLGDGLKGAFPGSDGIGSILQGIGGGLGNGAKVAPTARSVEELVKRQLTDLPAIGSPEARKSAGAIIDGLAKGLKGSGLPLGDSLGGLLSGVGSGLTAASNL